MTSLLDPRPTEGPTKSPLFVCPSAYVSVRPSVISAFFSGMAH